MDTVGESRASVGEGELPAWPDAVALSFEHEPMLARLATLLGAPYSDWHFSSVWSWNTDDSTTLSSCGSLLVMQVADYQGAGRIVSVAGHDPAGDDVCQVLEDVASVCLVPEPTAAPWKNDSRLCISSSEEDSDYVYALRSQAARRGQRCAPVRRALRQFETAVPDRRVDVLDLCAPAVRVAICDIFDAWATVRAGDAPEAERAALRRCLADSERLNIVGLGIFDGSTLLGYNLIDFTGDGQIGGFQKGLPGIPGLGVALWHAGFEFGLAQGRCWENGEQDLGIPGLRRHKRAMRPDKLLAKYTVTLR